MVTSMLDARNDARNEGGTYQRVEVITGRRRRRNGRYLLSAISNAARSGRNSSARPAIRGWRVWCPSTATGPIALAGRRLGGEVPGIR